jgi:hypothetical protein
MKKSLIVTIVLCAIVVVWVGMLVFRAYEKPGSMRHLQRIALQINERIPYEDEEFELTATAHSDRSLTLRYAFIDAYAEDFDDATKRQARETFRKHLCTNKALRELLETGVKMRIHVVDGDDVPMLQTEVLRWECGGAATAQSSR